MATTQPSKHDQDRAALLAQLELQLAGDEETTLYAILDDIERAARFEGLAIRHRQRAAVHAYCTTWYSTRTAQVKAIAEGAGLQERMVWRYMAAGEMLARNVGVGQGGLRNEALLRLDLQALEILKRLDAEQLAWFLTQHKSPWEMSRSEIRDAVAQIVGRERPPAPPKPVQLELALPGIETLLDLDATPATDPMREAQYMGTFGARLRASVHLLSETDWEQVEAGLLEEIQEIRDARNAALVGG